MTKIQKLREWVQEQQIEAASNRRALQHQGNPMGERMALGRATAFIEILNKIDSLEIKKTKKLESGGL